MDWKSITEAELWDKMNAAGRRMTLRQERLWDAIRIDPEKWRQEPYGNDAGGFWVVAVLGTRVVWYNDIEAGFNCSRYSHYGVIADYWCNQDELEEAVQRLLELIDSGRDTGPSFSPPIATGQEQS